MSNNSEKRLDHPKIQQKNSNISKRKILVTGGAGYVGSVLTAELLKNNYKVLVLDKLMFGRQSLSAYLDDPDFTLIQGDITYIDDVNKAVTKDIYAIIHLAAIVGDPACKTLPKDAERTNWYGSQLLLDRAEDLSIPRFIFASTCSNYGKMKDTDIVDESCLLRPISLYAELKVKFEQHILTKAFQNTAPTILRFSTVFGISPRMRFDLTVNHFTKDAFLDKKLLIFGEQFWRPYAHVNDVCQAILLSLSADKAIINKKVYNVGFTSENYTKKMIAEEILKVLPKTLIEFVKRDEDPRDYRVNSDKIRQELGLKCTITVPEGIEEVHKLLISNSISDPNSEIYRNT